MRSAACRVSWSAGYGREDESHIGAQKTYAARILKNDGDPRKQDILAERRSPVSSGGSVRFLDLMRVPTIDRNFKKHLLFT